MEEEVEREGNGKREKGRKMGKGKGERGRKRGSRKGRERWKEESLRKVGCKDTQVILYSCPMLCNALDRQ